MLLNISKGQATTIVLIIAGIIEVLLLLALIKNLSKKGKNNNIVVGDVNGFDGSQQNQSYDYTYQEPIPAPEPTFNNNVNQDMNNVAMADSAIPSMDFSQDISMNDNSIDSTFSGENLMNMQMNDTLDIPDNNMNYDNSNTTENYNDLSSPSSFESLDNLPDIIADNNDPLPMDNELGNTPNEVVEPIDNNFNLDSNIDLNSGLDSGIPEMSYDTPVDNTMDYNQDSSNIDLELNNNYDVSLDSSVDSSMDLNGLEVPRNDDI